MPCHLVITEMRTGSDFIDRYVLLTTDPSTRPSGERGLLSPVPGPDRGSFDLVTNVRNGQITTHAAVQMLSDVNIRYVDKNGENFDTGTSLADAAMALTANISPNLDLIDDCKYRVGT